MEPQTWESILKELERNDVSRVELIGEAGIGKTWMAREICKRATRNGGLFYIALWLNLNKEMDDMSLYQSIASQLSLFLENEESDEDDSDEEDAQDAEEQKKEEDLLALKDLISRELGKQMLTVEGTNKYLLLVLDDEGSVATEEKVMKGLFLEEFLAQGKEKRPLKILITRRKVEDENNSDDNEETKSNATDELDDNHDGEIESHATINSDEETKSNATDELDDNHDGEIEFHATINSVEETKSNATHTILRKSFTDEYLGNLLKPLNKDGLLVHVEKALGVDSGFLKKVIVDMSLRLPAAIVVLAKSIKFMAKKLPFCLSPKQIEVFKVAVLSSYGDVENDDSMRATSRCNPILQLAYELLQPDDTEKSVIVDCFWHSLSFFEHCGCVNYQELITHWILEGYFDPVRSVTKAYKDGHAILMELMNRGFLKIQKDNVVKPELAMKNLIDLRHRGLSGTSRIGLAKVIGSDMTKGLGKINQMDDIIEGVRGRKGEKVTTVLVSRNRLLRETPDNFFDKPKDLEILGLLQPTVSPLVSSVVKLEKLRVLVIRDCDLLDNIEGLNSLEGLHALEVSGASSLKEISDDFFKALSKLQSLHLSELQIKSSPSSISELTELQCLIIRDCPLLEDVPDIQELANLEVVDVSGARGLQTCFDNTNGEKKDHSKNKNFKRLTKLELLDFSESQLERLPIFQDSAVADNLHSLTRLILRDCSKLRRLPSLKPLSGLQILDLSGTTSLLKMLEVCFEDKKELRVLNLSGTNLCQLPSTIDELSNLRTLLLKDCPNLEDLPNIQKLTNLEVIDVSGCTELNKIEGSFEDMFYLREVNLFGTKVMITPDFLPKDSKINICCPKRLILADGRLFKGDKWSQIKEAMQKEIFDKASSSDEVIKSNEISEMESSKIQLNEPSSSDFPPKRGISKECFGQDSIYSYLYKKSIPFVNSESDPEVFEIHESNSLGGPHDLDYKALADAEYVSFVDSSSTRLTSILNQTTSAKGCWIRMCKHIKYLFSDVEEERLGSLETLSITNLPSLDYISRAGSFINLKNLSIDCCPDIVTLFPEASQLPSSLKILEIKQCEKLEKVFKEESQVSTLTTLFLVGLPVLSAVGAKLPNLETFNKKNCPNLLVEKEHLNGSEFVMVDRIEVVA